MIEGRDKPSGDMPSERWERLRHLVADFRHRGWSRRGRRERVIMAVAAEVMERETVEVQERAIGKYFQEIEGKAGVPILLVSLHGQLAKTDYQEVYNEVELPMSEIAAVLAKELGAAALIAKKSRIQADANRRSFFYSSEKARGVKLKSGKLVPRHELATSGRAAWYWGIKRAGERAVGLDQEGKLKRLLLMVSLHGMVNREHADIVLGGGDPDKGDVFIDRKLLKQLAETLVTTANQEKLVIKEKEGRDHSLRVAIHCRGDKLVERVSLDKQAEVVWERVERDKASLSGAGLGLDQFRSGGEFRVIDEAGQQRRLGMIGLGEGLQILQMEMGTDLRRLWRAGPEGKEKLTAVLAEALKGVFSQGNNH